MGRTRDPGAFAFDGLEPGSYDVAAVTNNGEFGLVRHLTVEAGGEPVEVVLVAEAGARLVLRYEGGRAYGRCLVTFEGVPVFLDGIERGTSSGQVVPPGTLRVELFENGETVEAREVQVAVGETRELVLGTGE